ncbi:unnamed protein product, partial [Meganyctiphanes norvegica]
MDLNASIVGNCSSTSCSWPQICRENDRGSFCECQQGYIFQDGLCKSYIQCPEGYNVNHGRCYKMYYDSVDWQSAQKTCKESGNGHLVNKPMGDWKTWLIDLHSGIYWVNVRKSAEGWFWSDGSKVIEWMNDEPSGSGLNNACAALCKDIKPKPPALYEVSCQVKILHFICEGPVVACLEGYFGGNCQN